MSESVYSICSSVWWQMRKLSNVAGVRKCHLYLSLCAVAGDDECHLYLSLCCMTGDGKC